MTERSMAAVELGNGGENNVHLKDWLTEGRKKLDEAREALGYLCEPVPLPREMEQFLHYFCGDAANPNALNETETLRIFFYKAVALFARAYADLAQNLAEASYDDTAAAALQKRLQGQARETPRRFIERESHYLWGRRYLLSVVEKDAKPSVRLSHRRITLVVRPGSTLAKRDEVMQEWHRSLLHDVVPTLIRKWEAKLGLAVSGYFLQRMKTKWGSCNPGAGYIRLNTELAKKPKDLLEYVIVHEMAH